MSKSRKFLTVFVILSIIWLSFFFCINYGKKSVKSAQDAFDAAKAFLGRIKNCLFCAATPKEAAE
ncbi:MAG: hypothetical protein ACK5MN_12505 [Lachnospiraceae bacterium]